MENFLPHMSDFPQGRKKGLCKDGLQLDFINLYGGEGELLRTFSEKNPP